MHPRTENNNFGGGWWGLGFHEMRYMSWAGGMFFRALRVGAVHNHEGLFTNPKAYQYKQETYGLLCIPSTMYTQNKNAGSTW